MVRVVTRGCHPVPQSWCLVLVLPLITSLVLGIFIFMIDEVKELDQVVTEVSFSPDL
jgi:hypothetical protein